MSRTDHWMPLYVGDYLADTMHLSGAEHGAYLMLLMHYWRTGPLPNDDKKLAAISRFAVRDFKKMSVSIRSFFVEDGDVLRQKRMDEELERMALISKKKREAADMRWQSKSNANGGSEPQQNPSTENADAMHMHSKSNADAMLRARALHPQLHPQKESEERKIQPSADANATFCDVRVELWHSGLETLRRITGKPDGPARSLLGKLVKAAQDDCARVLAALQEAADARPVEPIAWLTRAVTVERLTPLERTRRLIDAQPEEVPEWLLQ